MTENRQKIIKTIIEYLKNNGVKEIGLFGSFARGDMNSESDIDILVEYSRGTTLFDIVRMHRELGEKTGRKIDLVSRYAVRPRLMEYIQKDLQTVYNG